MRGLTSIFSSLAMGAALVLAGCSGAADDSVGGTDESVAAKSKTTLSVDGARLVDGKGNDVRLLGVNYDGAEYMCEEGRGIWDGPTDDALIEKIVSWNVNAVRLGVNEHCWLGLSDIDARFSGKTYRDEITGFVKRLRAHGLWVIVEVHLSSTIAGKATRQQPMLDRDNGLPFWRSVATTFAGDRGIVFDAFNEPFLTVKNTNHAFENDVWECWRLGCQVTDDGETYIAAGMQPIVDEIRGAGAKNVIMMGGIAYSNDLSGMLDHLPNDAQQNLAASFHVYDFNACSNEHCWDTDVVNVARAIPLVTGEVGETDCRTEFTTRYLNWADAHGLSYLGWTFNPGDCGKRPSLIQDWTGTPTPYGVALHDHLATMTTH
jgi:hypothetical protein